MENIETYTNEIIQLNENILEINIQLENIFFDYLTKTSDKIEKEIKVITKEYRKAVDMLDEELLNTVEKIKILQNNVDSIKNS